ncbi:MAG TPA: peptidylprolyl isomerase [Nitrospira sp.]|jgi:peptidyl-prolyl cis-trans isomerase B (cyclophilin B)|nr:peptidylprolyl isomerase [Nitrospira sp.]
MTRWMLRFGFVIGLVMMSAWIPVTAVLHAGEGAGVKPKAVIKTKFGDMEIVFFPDKAPNHVQNFIKLAKSGYYNGTIFHRVIPGFMIQGGDPNTKDPKRPETYGMGGPSEKLKAEFNDTPHRRGIVSMARTNDPNSAGSQFFIVVKDSNFLDGQYTAFGEVVKGMEVADKIVSLPRNPRNDLPNERVEITVTVE